MRKFSGMLRAMAQHEFLLFDGQRTVLDGEDFGTCCFKNCTLIYDGGEPPQFLDCTFIACNWLLGHVAVDEIKFMAVRMISEADELIEQLISEIRDTPENLSLPIVESSEPVSYNPDAQHAFFSLTI